MLKKALIMGLAAAMALSMAACGSPKKQETSLTKDAETQNVQAQNMQDENIQNEAARPDDAENIPEDNDTDYEICRIYFNYRTDILSGEEAEEQLQDFGVTLDEAEEIFNHYDGEAAEDIAMMRSSIPMHFEPTDEIMNATLTQFKLQVADMVFDSFSKVSDCMEKIENSELDFTYDYNPDKLVPFSSPGSGSTQIEIYLNGELYMKLCAYNVDRTPDDRTTCALKDCMLMYIELNDYSNSYYAGGIPAADSEMSAAELNSLFEKSYADSFGEDITIQRNEIAKDDEYSINYFPTVPYSGMEDGYLGHRYILECDGAAERAASYHYEATFDESGTYLKKLELFWGTHGQHNWSDEVREDSIIIER